MPAASSMVGREVVFSSSVAVFGSPLPEILGDATTPTPKSSYGIQKLIGELLVADYSRKGFIDGRSVRLPTVVVRPGKPNAAASSFASGIIREPLAGEESACPVEPDTALWITSPRAAVAAFIHAHETPESDWELLRSINLPGLTTSVQEMIAALRSASAAMPRGARQDGSGRAHPRDRRHLAGALHDRARRPAGIHGRVERRRHRASLRGVRAMTSKKTELDKRAGLKIVGVLRQGPGADRYGRDSAMANERRARANAIVPPGSCHSRSSCRPRRCRPCTCAPRATAASSASSSTSCCGRRSMHGGQGGQGACNTK